ncbi:hypothetical protein EON83_12430 [bacterium]|nr:MAG: hypothetical protein EON83_12430 [bacterium]
MNPTQAIFDQLKQPLDVTRVKKRQGGGGTQLSYIEAHDAISTLNRIFGYDGWKFELLGFQERATPKGFAYRQEVRLTARIGEAWVPREDVGIGIASNGNSDQIEKGMKEAVSDGLKRAARFFGDQFGNELYDKLAPEHSGQQRAAIATTAQLQECEALRQKAVQLGFRVKDGAEPKKQMEGAEERAVVAKTEAFRAYIQNHGDKGADSPTKRLDTLEDLGGLSRFFAACDAKGQPFANDTDIAAFEDAATKNAGMAVVVEDLRDEDWSDYAEQVENGFLKWGQS